ncbi:hypothetical protein OIO90_001757 [Microbotryomycetes sp. JL221]|nr:hypothetical protein OIO90_001757 [Microbotryomycetes sp. JL221]
MSSSMTLTHPASHGRAIGDDPSRTCLACPVIPHTYARRQVPIGLRWRCSTSFITVTVGFGILVDLAGYSLIVPLTPFRLQELGSSNVESKTGWLIASYGASLFLSSPVVAWLGAIVKQRKWPMIGYLAFMAVGIILFMETKSFTLMIFARILQGISGSGVWILGLALLSESAPEPEVGRAMGFAMIGNAIGACIGPIAGGILFEHVGYRAPFIFGLGLVGLNFILLLALLEKKTATDATVSAGEEEAPPPRNLQQTYTVVHPTFDNKLEKESIAHISSVDLPEVTASSIEIMWHGLKRMTCSARPMVAYAMAAIDGFILCGLLDAAMTLHLHDHYGLGSFGAGLVFIAVVVPAVLASPLAGHFADIKGAKYICTFGLIICAIGCPLLLVQGSLPVFVAVLAVLGSGVACFMSPLSQDLSVVLQEMPTLPSSFAYGAFNMAFSLGSFAGPLITGIAGARSTERVDGNVSCVHGAGNTTRAVGVVVHWWDDLAKTCF